jgi:hypothetical protein
MERSCDEPLQTAANRIHSVVEPRHIAAWLFQPFTTLPLLQFELKSAR